MAKESKDLFSNVAYGSVTHSAANTLTFQEIATGISVQAKIAWIISKITWLIDAASLAALAGASDILRMAVVLSNKITDLSDLSDPAIVDLTRLSVEVHGTAASGAVIRDLSFSFNHSTQ